MNGVMAHRWTLIILLTVVIAAPGVGAIDSVAATANQVTITVTVVDQSGDPIQNADLSATWEDGSTTATTRSNGKAFIDVPEGAEVEIAVDHRAYVRNVPYRIPAASAEEVTIEVSPKSTGTIVLADQDGAVPDAQVILRQDGQTIAQGHTNGNGEYTTGVIEAGEYTVRTYKSGYYRKTETLSIRGDTRRELTLERGTVTVTFLVQDQNFNPPEPVADATISGEKIGSVRTQPNGMQRVTVPVNSMVEVSVTKPGYRTITKELTIQESDTEVEIATRKEPEISFDLAMDRVVVGETMNITITDQYANPVADATVYLDDESIGTSSRDGIVSVPITAAGEHTIHAETDSLTTDQQTIIGVKPAASVTVTETDESSGEASAAASAPATTEPNNEAPQQASVAGLIAIPGTSQQVHLKSVGAGIGLGAGLMIVLVGYGLYRSRGSSE